MMKKWVCLAKYELELLVGISRESAQNLSSGPSIKRPQKTKNEKKKTEKTSQERLWIFRKWMKIRSKAAVMSQTN